MMDNFIYSNKYSYELERCCAELIENELSTFFNVCSKSAYVYSLMVAQNMKSHNEENFRNSVLNEDEIIRLINNIISRLNDFLNRKPS